MQLELEDFKTGWFGLRIGITEAEIPLLIERLEALQRNGDHFHLRSDFFGLGGVGDVEVFLTESNAPHNAHVE